MMAKSDATITGAMLIAAVASVVLCFPRFAPAQQNGAGAGSALLLPEGHAFDSDPSTSDPLADIIVEFELTDRDGRIVSAEDFRGRYVLLGFGFTHCPHICPMMARNMGRALRNTDKDAAGIFVSVDTERDSPEVTDEYASRFGEAMMGLGGSIEQINVAAGNFKVSYAITKTQNSYTVQHTANVYLIDPEGRLADVFPFSTPAETLMEAMR
jgi:cytochrome oxidase Cu insertion factor (SCO1/SenC/PrrC family)